MFPVDQEKREKLTDLLFELSKSQEILATPKDRAGYFRKLEEIYYLQKKDGFTTINRLLFFIKIIIFYNG